MAALRAPLAAAAVLLLAVVAVAQECGDTNVMARGAAGNGQQDDAPAFLAMESDPGAGVIYMAKGTYRIGQTITLSKPVIGDAGAVFQVDAGVQLNLVNQPEHPLTTFFTGDGQVTLREGCVRAYPEWWGAVGDGQADDRPALSMAFSAIAETGNSMLYLTQTYGLGSELQLTNRATIFAQPTAKLVSINGNPYGLTLLEGGYGFKNVLPHVSGFSDFCVRLLGADLAAIQMQTISDCGDGIRLECLKDGTPDRDAALDNTVWFDTITNSRNAIAVRGGPYCNQSACVFQGNQFVGNAIQGGPSDGQAAAILYAMPPGFGQPAWDSNQFDLAIVTPPEVNPAYQIFRTVPEVARAVIKIARLDPMPDGSRMFGPAVNHMMQITINLAQQLKESQFGLYGLLNLVTLTGATTPLPGAPPVRCVNQQNSKAKFNGGRSLVGNSHRLVAVPDTDWAAGEVKTVFIFHQFATGMLYQIKCNAPANDDGTPSVDCVQYNDNTNGNPGVPPTPEEIQLYLINLTGKTILAGTEVPFKVALATLGNPGTA